MQENDAYYSNLDKLKLVFPDEDYWSIKNFSCGIASDGSKFINAVKSRLPSIATGVVGGIGGGIVGGVVGGVVGIAAGEGIREITTSLIDVLIKQKIKIPKDKIRKEFDDIEYSKYRSLSEMFKKYFDALSKGNEIGMRYDKKNAVEYYSQALHCALDIRNKSGDLIDTNWLNATIIADVYSRLGSTYSDNMDFNEARKNFYEADELLKSCKTENENISFLDRRIEIKGYDMGNSMRNMREIGNFLGSKEFDVIEKSFTNEIDNYIQILPERNSFASYFDKRLFNIAQEYSTEKTDHFYSNIYIYDKMRYLSAIGKFLATRACYDFIQFIMNKNNTTAKEETERKIYKGLNLIIEGYNISFGNITYRDTLIEDYIGSNSCYNIYLQKTLARNFTILMGLGYLSSDKQLFNKYIRLLIRLDKKERMKDCRASYNIMWDGVKTAVEKVLKPYINNIIPYEKIKSYVDKANNV